MAPGDDTTVTIAASHQARGLWGVIPAAGTGQRMGAALPKQYLELHGKTILQHSCERLLQIQQLRGLVVAVRNDDQWWPHVAAALADSCDKPVASVTGGHERADSVLNALQHLHAMPDAQNCMVLVHDAVRPCVRLQDIQQLIDAALAAGDDGALLAMPVRDTMKRADVCGRVSDTVARENLWHALTPQCFPLPVLMQALQQAAEAGSVITDESSAMEQAGFRPRLIAGAEDNIKITRPYDLQLAERSLK